MQRDRFVLAPAAYLPGGEKTHGPTATCRACHLSMASKDFVHRSDEHFGRQSALARQLGQPLLALRPVAAGVAPHEPVAPGATAATH